MDEPTIGVYIIARNNANTIASLVDLIYENFTEDIYVLDTGSTDGTPQFASELGAKIGFYEYPKDWKHPFLDDFAKARNQAMDQLDTDWVVWFDTDDHPTVETLRDLKRAIHIENPNSDVDIIATFYSHFSFEQDKGVSLHMSKNKAWRKGTIRWKNRIHEQPYGDDTRTVFYKIYFTTYAPPKPNTHRNLTIFEDIISKQEEIGIEQWFDMAREYRQLDDYTKMMEYVTIYISKVEELDTLIVDETRSRRRHLSLAYHYRAIGHVHFKDYSKAKLDCLAGIAIDDSLPQHFIMIGFLYAKKQNYHRAIPWYIHAYNMPKLPFGHVDFRGIRVFHALGYLATAYAKVGDIDNALKMYDKVLAYNPDKNWLNNHKHLANLKEEYKEVK